MINIESKSKISTIAIILVLTISAILVALPLTNAQQATLFTASTEERGIINVPFSITMSSREDLAFEYTGVKLGVRSHGSANFVYQTTTYTADEDGFVEAEYTATDAGFYEFVFNVPAPQGPLEANPSSSDGSYTTNIADLEVVTEYTTDTFAFVNAMPNVVGVNQDVLLHFGITTPTLWPQTGWDGVEVEIQKPNGDSETLGPFHTDLTGGAGQIWVPDQVGDYLIRTHFPQQQAQQATAGFPVGTTLLESYSDWFTVTVTAEPQPDYPGQPLPTEYWSRPIDSQFWDWYPITGDYLGRFRATNPDPDVMRMVSDYNKDAPETGHVLWAKPLIGAAISPLGGGLAGADRGQHSYEIGDAYEGEFNPPVIMGGVIFFNKYKSGGSTRNEQLVVAVDLRTGEELWERNWDNRQLDFGQSFFYTGFNYHAVFQYLWETTGGTWNAYEASSGRWVYGMDHVPRGTMMYGPNGEIIIYTIDLQDGWMTKWNSRWVIDGQRWIDNQEENSLFGSWLREYQGRTLDGRVGIEWNVTIPVPHVEGDMQLQELREGYMLFSNFEKRAPAPASAEMWAISFDPVNDPSYLPVKWVDTTYGTVPRKDVDPGVTLLFEKPVEIPKDKAILNVEDASLEDGIIEVIWSENPSIWAYNATTGDKLWGPVGPLHYQTHWSYESGNSWDLIYQGKILAGGHGGTLYAIDAFTGNFLWNFSIPDPYNEYLFNNWWRFRIAFIADGKAYLEHSEHSPFDPKPRGAPFVCVDLSNGQEVWRATYLRGTEWGEVTAIGDSILVRYNTYDDRTYAVGKGPSETTISIQNDVVSLGSSVLVKGMVTDISPGTEESNIKARFPKGLPAVSDESMTAWMTYVYTQASRPGDVTGVAVSIDAYDPNGNLVHLGDTTSDAAGFYSFKWTPEDEGEYTVTTTFMGSKSYYASYAETAISVGPAAPTGGPIQPEGQAPLITTEVAILIAVVVIAAVAIAAYWVLRRR